jgi:hypothetical protein
MYERTYKPFNEAVRSFLIANGWRRANNPGEPPTWRHPAHPRVRYAPGDAVCATQEAQALCNLPVQHITITTLPALTL